ncbi:MAG: helicase-associated domain-containing protein [Frankiaceae bacterium]
MDSPRSLAEWLRARTDDELTSLLAARPDLANPVPPDFAALAARAATRGSVLRALDGLDRHRLAVLEAIALLDEPVGRAELAAFVGDELGPPGELAAAVAALRGLALVWGEDDLHLVRVARDLLTMPARLGPPVLTLVSRYPPALWRPLLAALDLPPAPDALTAAAQVAGRLRDGGAVRALVAGLGADERHLLGKLTWSPVGSVTDALRPLPDPGEDAAAPVWRRLLRLGLLAAVDPDTVVVPREVGLALRDGQVFPPGHADRRPLDVTERPVRLVERTAAGQAFATVRAVTDLLDWWGLDPPAMLRSGGLGVRELRRTARAFDLDDALTALYVEVAYAAGLVAPSGDADAVWLPSPAFDAWRRGDPARRWAGLADAWLTTTRTPGLVGSKDERDRTLVALSPEIERVTGPAVREATLGLLAGLPPGTSAGIESLAADVQWLAPRRHAGRTADHVRWTLAEAEALGVTGAGALSTPARHLLAGDPAAAAAALEPLLPEPVDHVLVQADLTAVAPGPLVPELARELHLAADVESKGAATVYRFSEASVRRALDAGRSAAELHDLLDRRSRTPVPQPLHYLIDDVARRHGRIRVGTAQAYVRSDDPAVLQEIVASRKAEPLRPRMLAPTVLAVRAPVDRTLEVLRAMGHAPVAESPEGDVVLHRPDARRAPARARPPRAHVPPPLAPALLVSAVRAVRAGDRVATSMPRLPRPAGPAEAMVVLRQAALDGRLVWIGYLNAEGEASQRMIEPRRVDGGQVVAYDHRTSSIRTFMIHRIIGVAPVDDDAPA